MYSLIRMLTFQTFYERNFSIMLHGIFQVLTYFLEGRVHFISNTFVEREVAVQLLEALAKAAAQERIESPITTTTQSAQSAQSAQSTPKVKRTKGKKETHIHDGKDVKCQICQRKRLDKILDSVDTSPTAKW